MHQGSVAESFVESNVNAFIQPDDDHSYTSRRVKKKGKMSTTMYIVVAVLVIGVLLTFINVWELRRMQSEHMSMHGMPEAESDGGGVSKKPLVWIHGKNVRICPKNLRNAK